MKTASTFWPALAACAIVAALFRPAAAMSDDVSPPVASRSSLPLLAMPVRLPSPVLAVEVLSALHYWTRRPLDILRSWANAIADVARDRAEAIWFASQAAVEGGFAPEVLSFECNDATYRAVHIPGECDHGFAVGPWQQHSLALIGASPDVQAARAAQWMRARPQAWTTWRAARAQADAWLHAE